MIMPHFTRPKREPLGQLHYLVCYLPQNCWGYGCSALDLYRTFIGHQKDPLVVRQHDGAQRISLLLSSINLPFIEGIPFVSRLMIITLIVFLGKIEIGGLDTTWWNFQSTI